MGPYPFHSPLPWGPSAPTRGLGIQAQPVCSQHLPAAPSALAPAEEWGPLDPQRKPPHPTPTLVPVVTPTLWDIIASLLAEPATPVPASPVSLVLQWRRRLWGFWGRGSLAAEKHWSR